jgi:hypothetical protein
MLAEAQFARNHERSAAPSYIKGFVRKGFAYIGLRRWRDAKGAFEAGLQYDPFSEDLKRGLEESTQGILKDLIEGRSKEVCSLPVASSTKNAADLDRFALNREPLTCASNGRVDPFTCNSLSTHTHTHNLTPLQLLQLILRRRCYTDPFSECSSDLKTQAASTPLSQLASVCPCLAQVRALPAPPKKERIGYLPYDAPLHRIHPKDMLPVRLLTPFQAENDYHVKDTYNYMTVQTDIRQPKRHLHYIEDAYFHDTWERALRVAVDRIQVRALPSKSCDRRE